MTPLDNLTTQRVLQLADKIVGEGVKEIKRPRRRTLRISKVKELTVGGSPAFLFAAGIVDSPEKHHFSHLMHFIVTEEKLDTGTGPRFQIFPALYRNDNKRIQQDSVTIKGKRIIAEDKYLQAIQA